VEVLRGWDARIVVDEMYVRCRHHRLSPQLMMQLHLTTNRFCVSGKRIDLVSQVRYNLLFEHTLSHWDGFTYLTSFCLDAGGVSYAYAPTDGLTTLYIFNYITCTTCAQRDLQWSCCRSMLFGSSNFLASESGMFPASTLLPLC
jgi:hypothetical protein